MPGRSRFLRLVDRDYVELSNLQRQTLYTEEDAQQKTPKAVAACEHLKIVNSEIELEPVTIDVNSSNIEELISDVNLVLDGSDNLEVRYLINEACVKQNRPWIYAGAIIGTGMTMNILPRETPCLRCLFPQVLPAGTGPTCSTAGVLNGITGIVASIVSTEAIKILVGSTNVRKSLLAIDIWNNQFDEIKIEKKLDCPVCGQHKYELLGQLSGSYPAYAAGIRCRSCQGHQQLLILSSLPKGLKRLGLFDTINLCCNFLTTRSNLIFFRMDELS